MALTKIKRMNKKWKHEQKRKLARIKRSNQVKQPKAKRLHLVEPIISDDPVDKFINNT
jgi:hypothetical protein